MLINDCVRTEPRVLAVDIDCDFTALLEYHVLSEPQSAADVVLLTEYPNSKWKVLDPHHLRLGEFVTHK